MTTNTKSAVHSLSAPVAQKIPHTHTEHGLEREDPYYWLNDRDDPAVIEYLEQENEYREKVMAHTAGFQAELFEEIVGRIKQDDESVPYPRNGYYYYDRFEEKKEHPIHCRKKESMEGKEEVLLDVNERAQGYEYYVATNLQVSPDNAILAYAEDTLSRRIFTIRFKDLTTGEHLEDIIPNTGSNLCWANDNKHLFYAVKDETLREYKIFRHKLGTPSEQDIMVWHEEDPTFSTYVYRTTSEKFIVIGSYSTLTNSYRFVEADKPTSTFTEFTPRTRGLEYFISHAEDKFYIVTNQDAQNFKLMECPENNTHQSAWKEVIPHRDNVLLEYVSVFKNHMVLQERKNGILHLRVISKEGDDHIIDFGEDAYFTYPFDNYDYDTETLRLRYTSLKTPWSTFDYDMSQKKLHLLKEQEVVGGYDKEEYETSRLYAPAADGTEVPISLVHKKGITKDGSNPLLLYGYGSYGNSLDPYFSTARLSLLDRGFVYAIAHVRGGQELGRPWYENGKLLNKKNSFTDFIDCTQFLNDQGYASPEHTYAMGGSAGGLLMGAVINMAPQLYNGVIAQVPFVDVVTTMLDESIPLTTGEFDEWGNPKDKEYFDYILSYSPYDQVKAQEYPSLLVTTGLHDSQVQYWEPAKWVARLRTLKTDSNPLLLYCNMSTGHGGSSGRFEYHRETAMEYAFLLDLEGIDK